LPLDTGRFITFFDDTCFVDHSAAHDLKRLRN
jgi:hypothetical protein